MKKSPLEAATEQLAALQDIHAYDDAAASRKDTFHRVGRTWLRQLAKALGVDGACDVRSNMGGIAVSGEVTLHSDTLYVQLSEGAIFGRPGLDILYRTCQGRKDYTGGQNNFVQVASLNDEQNLAKFIQRCRDLSSVHA